jgi:ribonuclease III
MAAITNIYNRNNRLLTADDVYAIFEKIGFQNARDKIRINDLALYQQAFIHKSYCRNQALAGLRRTGADADAIELFPEDHHYENMEFLGDRCLELAVSWYIFRRYPDSSPGEKTILKTKLVCTAMLNKYATYLGFDRFIIISKYIEEVTEHGRRNPRHLEDVFEAFISAVFQDQNMTMDYLNREALAVKGDFRLCGCGWQIVNALIENLMERLIDFDKLIVQETNFKNPLLNFYQQTFRITPEYVSGGQEGPPHRRVFVEFVLDKNGAIVGRGVGKSKQDAQQMAAKDALIYFKQLTE